MSDKAEKLKRSDTWNNIYEVLARLDLKEVEGDCLDRPSAATEIEALFNQEVKAALKEVEKSLPSDEEIEEWVSSKMTRTVEELDAVDLYICELISLYLKEQTLKQ